MNSQTAPAAVFDTAAATEFFSGAAKVFPSEPAKVLATAAPDMSALAVGAEPPSPPAPQLPAATPKSALELLQERVDALNQVVVDLPALLKQNNDELRGDVARCLDERLQAAITDTLLNNGEVLAQALAPYAGAIVRKGLAQTGLAVVTAAPRLAMMGWAKLTSLRKAKAPAVPAAPMAACAAAAYARAWVAGERTAYQAPALSFT